MKENYLNSSQVSEITGFGVETIRHFVRHGLLKVYRVTPHGKMRFKRSDIDRALTEGVKKKG